MAEYFPGLHQSQPFHSEIDNFQKRLWLARLRYFNPTVHKHDKMRLAVHSLKVVEDFLFSLVLQLKSQLTQKPSNPLISDRFSQ